MADAASVGDLYKSAAMNNVGTRQPTAGWKGVTKEKKKGE